MCVREREGKVCVISYDAMKTNKIQRDEKTNRRI